MAPSEGERTHSLFILRPYALFQALPGKVVNQLVRLGRRKSPAVPQLPTAWPRRLPSLMRIGLLGSTNDTCKSIIPTTMTV